MNCRTFLFGLIVGTFMLANSAKALDFDKEIGKQEVVSVSLVDSISTNKKSRHKVKKNGSYKVSVYSVRLITRRK